MTDKQAAAIRKIAEGLYELADVLFEQPELVGHTSPVQGSGSTPPGPAPDFPPFEPSEESLLDEIFPEDVKAAPRGEQPQGSLARCPSHDVLFKEGRYGKYCPSLSKDPAWSNSKGYCTISPKNVDIWLRAQAATPA